MKWTLFFTCWLVLTLHWSPWLVREHIPAWSLVERGTLNVENYEVWSEDIFRGPQGGMWINNNPGASLLGAVVLLPFRGFLVRAEPPRPVKGGSYGPAVERGRFRAIVIVTFVTVVLVMAPLSAAAATMLGAHLAVTLPERTAAAIGLLYTFATPVFLRALYLNHNLIVGQLGLIAFLMLWKRELESRPVLLAGLLSGFAVLCDFTGALVCLTLFLWIVWRAGFSSALRFAAAAIPGVLALAAYQYIAFGNPFLPSQHYMQPTAPTHQGYRGFAGPSLDLAWANLMEPRWGLAVYCPLLLFAFVAPFRNATGPSVPRPVMRLILASFVLFFVFCSANQYSWLQWTTGFRYLIPTVAGLLLLSLQIVNQFPAWLRFAVLAFSLAHQWVIAMTYYYPAQAWASIATDGLQLSWLREMRASGFCEAWYWSPYLMFGASLAILTPLWRRALRCESTRPRGPILAAMDGSREEY